MVQVTFCFKDRRAGMHLWNLSLATCPAPSVRTKVPNATLVANTVTAYRPMDITLQFV